MLAEGKAVSRDGKRLQITLRAAENTLRRAAERTSPSTPTSGWEAWAPRPGRKAARPGGDPRPAAGGSRPPNPVSAPAAAGRAGGSGREGTT